VSPAPPAGAAGCGVLLEPAEQIGALPLVEARQLQGLQLRALGRVRGGARGELGTAELAA
jgi:hypothetical protein